MLKWSIPGRVDISQAIPSLVNWAEEQLDDRYTDAQCHSVRISDPDPELAAIYKEAGQVLTYMATKQLKKTIDLMVRREDKMTVLEIGVQERLIKNNEEIIIQYETTPEACSCTFVRQFNCPCRHMLLLRRTLGLPLFDLSLYAPQHLVNRCHDPLVQEHEHQELLGKNPNRINQHGHDDVDEAEQIEKVLLPSQKHNIVFPKLQRISNLLCSFHGTKSFLSYVEEIDIIEQRVRRGQSIFSEMDTILEEDIDKVVEPEEIAEINVKDCETMDKGGESLEDTTDICGEGGSFNLKFMAKVALGAQELQKPASKIREKY